MQKIYNFLYYCSLPPGVTSEHRQSGLCNHFLCLFFCLYVLLCSLKTMIKDIYKLFLTQSVDILLGYNHKHIQPYDTPLNNMMSDIEYSSQEPICTLLYVRFCMYASVYTKDYIPSTTYHVLRTTYYVPLTMYNLLCTMYYVPRTT